VVDPATVSKANSAVVRTIQVSENCDTLVRDIMAAVADARAANPGARKLPAEGTIRQYLATVRGLRRLITGVTSDSSDFEFLRDVAGVSRLVDTKWAALGTRATKYNGVASLLRWLTAFQAEYKQYSTVSSRLAKEKEVVLDQNISSEAEKAYITWEQILAMVPNARTKRDLAVLSLYTLQQPRRIMDYYMMRIHTATAAQIKSGIAAKLDPQFNWMVLTPGAGHLGQLRYNMYKTAKHYGSQEFTMDRELVNYYYYLLIAG
jgi:hypothetical protein